ncbi:hypothetical protein [Actinomadura litoris]|uniref:hypothetical protein n=1 Tax=Actinomadura litoris TaxID=2678616 RepID=UPI001FA73095|nr:hypothetical protein [Actinomadura litoris]
MDSDDVVLRWSRDAWEEMPSGSTLKGSNAVRATVTGTRWPPNWSVSVEMPEVTEVIEDEIADRIGDDGRRRPSRLHPYRGWEPLDLAR